MTSKGSISFSFFKVAKLENSTIGPSAAAMRLEIWHMFNMLVWTCQKLSYDVLYTAFVVSLKLYSGLNFVSKFFLYKIVNLRKPNHLPT